MIADRTACSILTLFIAIATCRPLNKKSVRYQSADPTINADLRPQSAVRTPLLHLQSHRSRHRHGTLCVIADKRAVPFRLPCTRVAWIHRHLWRFSLRFLWCILWLNGRPTSYSKKVSEGTNRNMPTRNTLKQLLALYTNPESQNARVTDRRTDRRTTGWCQ